LLADGLNFPDALAGGAMAFDGDFPMLLTDPNTLSAATSSALTALNISQVFILGGGLAVSPAVETAVQGMGITTMRLDGATRMGTAAAIATYELANLGFSNTTAILARGDAFPDAESSGPLAGHQKTPILLTNTPDILSDETTAFLQGESGTLTSLTILGGGFAISVATAAAAQSAAS
jgi:putative cell wall-binding protein